MAQPLERFAAAGLVLAFATFSAHAQGALVDPTRPQFLPAPQAGGNSGGAQGMRLQSVLISATRQLAVIDGMTVPLGGQVNGATLVSVTETGVTLQRGSEVQNLKLHPNVERRDAGQLSAQRENKKGTAQ